MKPVASLSIRILRAVVVAGGVFLYLAYVFRLGGGQFRSMALGDWMDPYFINALMEHWYRAFRTLSNPASPPMFYPARQALGYSHGLILYAPFYIPLRIALHPFQAYNLTIFLVLGTGSVCLYLLLRRLQMRFAASLALTALFVSSPNVMNGFLGVWTQRASVFLIPPILLLAASSGRASSGRMRALAGFATGLLGMLLYVQDFYTAHFAALMAVWFGMAAVPAEGWTLLPARSLALWARHPRGLRVVMVVLSMAALAAAVIFVTGGAAARVQGINVAARDWKRPAWLALFGMLVVGWQDAPLRDAARRAFASTWLRGCALGAVTGAGVFLWLYLPAFHEHSAFAREEVWNGLAERAAFLSLRPFIFVAVISVLTWIPWFQVDGRGRRYAVWLLVGSAFVLLAPLKFGQYSVWMAFVARLPGFAVIRDPKRIIYLYELAVVLAAAAIVARAHRPAFGFAIAGVAMVLIAANPNRERFDYERSSATFNRWVGAPIAMDPSCRSFFVKRASVEYMSRSGHMGTLYGIDAIFVALNHSIPTLNGYSAWYPEAWDLWNPQEASYPGRVQTWIHTHHLADVCELDIDARTMTPVVPR